MKNDNFIYEESVKIYKETLNKLSGMSDELNDYVYISDDAIDYLEDFELFSSDVILPLISTKEHYQSISNSEFYSKYHNNTTDIVLLLKILTESKICSERFLKAFDVKDDIARYIVYSVPGDLSGECIYAIREIMAFNGYCQTRQYKTCNRYGYQFEPIKYIDETINKKSDEI